MNNISLDFSTIDELKKELKRSRRKKHYKKIFFALAGILVLLILPLVVISALKFPILIINGNSMSPTINDNDIVVAFKDGEVEKGDLIVFNYQNNISVKRIVAMPKDIVNIDENGNVYINDVPSEEPYVTEKVLGDCNLDFPFTVPEGEYFVLSDNRAISIDSRNNAFGCVEKEQIVGKIVFRVWPISN